MHPLLRAAAERQLGLVTAADARRAGYEHPEIRRLCASGAWTRLRRGVYSPEADLDGLTGAARHRVDCCAVLLELGRPAAAVSHGSAARLHGLPVRRGQASTVRLTDPSTWRHGRGFRMNRAPLDPGDVVVSGALRLTSAARTLVDCAREWDLEDGVVAIDAALLAERTDPGRLRSAASAARSWPGGRTAARAVALADGRAESPLETRGRLRIVGAGLPSPGLQVEIRAGGRLVAVVDAWFDDAAVAVEFDGRVKYPDPRRGRTAGQVLWEEKRREDELRALDIAVLRIADADVGSGWPRAEDRLRRLLSRPRLKVRRFTAILRRQGVPRAG